VNGDLVLESDIDEESALSGYSVPVPPSGESERDRALTG